MAYLFCIIASVGTAILDLFLPVFSILFALAIIIPSLAMGIRRLRDAGKHWSNIFWNFLPIAGTIVYIVFLCKPSVVDDGTPVV